jgi:glycosyltransferase involved in cell wall biosynthesis
MLLRRRRSRDGVAGVHHGQHRDHSHRCNRRGWQAGLGGVRPDISVVIPVYNEKSRLERTIRSIAEARTTAARLEFVVVDDGSTDGTVANLLSALPRLLKQPAIDIRVEGLNERMGNYHARNRGADLASADVLVMTDAHVGFSIAWDEAVLRRLRPDRILSGVSVDPHSGFKGFGLRLSLPDMGVVWNEHPHPRGPAVQVAPCHATALPTALFRALGGYDVGMLLYGGGGTEFSVRAWTWGAQIHCAPEFEVEHRFKDPDEFAAFLYEIRHLWIHNCIRFAWLYLDEPACLSVIRHYADAFPAELRDALSLFDETELADRRLWLDQRRRRSFDWFAGHLAIERPPALAV